MWEREEVEKGGDDEMEGEGKAGDRGYRKREGMRQREKDTGRE